MKKKKTIMSKIICFVMCMALVLAYVPYDAKAEESVVVLDVSVDYIIITDEGYQQGNRPELIPYTGDYIITGTTNDSSHHVRLESLAEGSTVTLKDLTMDLGATVPISVWEPMEIYATGDVNLTCSGNCINFIYDTTDAFSIKGDADLVLKSSPWNAIHTDELDLDIECNSVYIDGIYMYNGSVDISAIEDITLGRDIFISGSTEGTGPVTLTAGGDIELIESRCPVVTCTTLTVNAGGDFTVESDENVYDNIIRGNTELNVGGDVSITSVHGKGIQGDLKATVGGDFELTGYMNPLCYGTDITAKSIYMCTEDTYSSDCVINAGADKEVFLTATEGDIVVELATGSGGAIYAKASYVNAPNGNVNMTNENYFLFYGDAFVDAKNIELLAEQSVAPIFLANANLIADENITLATQSVDGISSGNTVVDFGDSYTETNPYATYVVKKGNTVDYTYDGTGKYADITVTKDGVALTSGSDFSVTYKSDDAAVAEPIDAGTYVATVKDSGGELIVDITYDIIPYDLTDAKLTLDATEFTFDEKEKTVNVSKVDEFEFNTTDFIITGNKATNVGEYTLTVEGKSENFTGSATAKYSIVEAKKPAATETTTYTILSGADSVWNTSAGGEVVVRADGDFDKFVSLQVDGKTLDKDDYTAVSGSTIVTLKPAFLKTLPAGEHTITFVYTDGMVSTQFEVKDVAVDVDGSPATGDAFSIMFMLMLMTMSMLAFVTMKREHIKEK